VPEERKTEGIFPGLSTLANVTVSSLKKASTGGLIRPRKEYGESLDATNEVDLPERYLPLDIDALSGGNQQKAVLARSLMGKAKLLLLYDPSRGVDVGTKTSIYELMRKFVSGDGDAILWYSTDLAELTGVCDRILCFYKGSVVAEMPGEGSSVESLLQAITGHGTAKETVR
jgi:ribose transport system ATP-binding protein